MFCMLGSLSEVYAVPNVPIQVTEIDYTFCQGICHAAAGAVYFSETTPGPEAALRSFAIDVLADDVNATAFAASEAYIEALDDDLAVFGGGAISLNCSASSTLSDSRSAFSAAYVDKSLVIGFSPNTGMNANDLVIATVVVDMTGSAALSADSGSSVSGSAALHFTSDFVGGFSLNGIGAYNASGTVLTGVTMNGAYLTLDGIVNLDNEALISEIVAEAVVAPGHERNVIVGGNGDVSVVGGGGGSASAEYVMTMDYSVSGNYVSQSP
ncbi:MAG: hypothetical protein ACRC1K_05170 [Planctomycetia bacterium]